MDLEQQELLNKYELAITDISSEYKLNTDIDLDKIEAICKEKG